MFDGCNRDLSMYRTNQVALFYPIPLNRDYVSCQKKKTLLVCILNFALELVKSRCDYEFKNSNCKY